MLDNELLNIILILERKAGNVQQRIWYPNGLLARQLVVVANLHHNVVEILADL